MKLGSKVVTGETSEVFDWGSDRVVKLFREDYPTKAVEQEYINAHAVKQLDFYKARERGIVAYGSRTGIVFERLTGDNLLDVILKTGKLEEYIGMLCRLHQAILENAMFDEDIRYYKHILLERSEASKEMAAAGREILKQKIRALPDGSQLCHGDFRPRKVILTEKGAAVVDFDNVCRGPKLYDIAVTYCILCRLTRAGSAEEQRHLHEIRGQMADEYLVGMRVMKEEITPFLEVIECLIETSV